MESRVLLLLEFTPLILLNLLTHFGEVVTNLLFVQCATKWRRTAKWTRIIGSEPLRRRQENCQRGHRKLN
jgi:hypothetical protein